MGVCLCVVCPTDVGLLYVHGFNSLLWITKQELQLQFKFIIGMTIRCHANDVFKIKLIMKLDML